MKAVVQTAENLRAIESICSLLSKEVSTGCFAFRVAVGFGGVTTKAFPHVFNVCRYEDHHVNRARRKVLMYD